MRRRELLTGAAAFAAASALAGCAKITNAVNDNDAVKGVLHSAERLNHVVIGTRGSAKLYPDSAIDREFRVNGFDTPADSTYAALRRDAFASYKLVVDGAVDRPQALPLPQLRALATSAIGKWQGVQLATVLALAQPRSNARFVIFHCFDRSSDGDPYYESLDLHEAAHPQTLLALDLNDRPLDADHGAPVRLRVPTQLGYKSAKWVQRIELAENFKSVGNGKGGYWEDQGYDWYAGI